MSRRRQFSQPAPGVAKVRLSGDTVAADVLAAILRAHPAVEILTGPDRYDDGRQYLTVRVRMDGGLGRDVPGFLPDCARCGHPEDAHHVPGPDMLPRHCATPGCDCPGWRSAAGMAMDAPGPRLLPAPCSDYSPCVPYAPCETCGRTREAHRIAAAAAGEPWTDDNNDGGTP